MLQFAAGASRSVCVQYNRKLPYYSVCFYSVTLWPRYFFTVSFKSAYGAHINNLPCFTRNHQHIPYHTNPSCLL